MFQKRKWIAAFLTLALTFSLCNTSMGVSEVKAQEAETNEYEYSIKVEKEGPAELKIGETGVYTFSVKDASNNDITLSDITFEALRPEGNVEIPFDFTTKSNSSYYKAWDLKITPNGKRTGELVILFKVTNKSKILAEKIFTINVVSDSTEDTDSTAPHVSSVSIQPNITDGVFEQKLTCSMDVTDVGVAKPTSVAFQVTDVSNKSNTYNISSNSEEATFAYDESSGKIEAVLPVNSMGNGTYRVQSLYIVDSKDNTREYIYDEATGELTNTEDNETKKTISGVTFEVTGSTVVASVRPVLKSFELKDKEVSAGKQLKLNVNVDSPRDLQCVELYFDNEALVLKSEGKQIQKNEDETYSCVFNVDVECAAGEYSLEQINLQDTNGKWVDYTKDGEIWWHLTENSQREEAECIGTTNLKIVGHVHSYTTQVVKATLNANGKIVKKCSCGAVESTTAIAYPKTIGLTATDITYNGKTQTPAVRVTGSDGKAISASNYTVSYASGRKKIGRYAVTITFKNNYTGKITKTFNINPKGTKISKVKGAKKKATVTWKKQTKYTKGYQVQYSTSKNFKSGVKTKTVNGSKKTSLTLKKLKSKKTYYVRIRTFQKVSGGKCYSSWSSVKKVKVK